MSCEIFGSDGGLLFILNLECVSVDLFILEIWIEEVEWRLEKKYMKMLN